MKHLFSHAVRIAFCGLLFATLAAAALAEEAAIKHRFLAADESRTQLMYVDQFDPSKDWTIKTPEKNRDLQLIGGGKLLTNTGSGYREYDLKTQKTLKEFKKDYLSGATSAQRLPNGHTVVGCNKKDGISFAELDASDNLVTTCTLQKINTLRLFRFTSRGTILFGAMEGKDSKVFEVNMKGEILRQQALPEGKHNYFALELPNGNLLVPNGYGAAVEEVDKTGKTVRKLGGKPGLPGLLMNFFAGMQVLKNGNVVVCNWTGHGAKDSEKAPQILEFDKDGKVVWQWHDAQRAGSIHAVIIMDGLDPNVLNIETGGVLGPVKK